MLQLSDKLRVLASSFARVALNRTFEVHIEYTRSVLYDYRFTYHGVIREDIIVDEVRVVGAGEKRNRSPYLGRPWLINLNGILLAPPVLRNRRAFLWSTA